MFVKIVNEKGREIGCIDRSYLIKLGLKHQVARVIVFAADSNEVLLQQRSLRASSCSGMWDTSSSGHVDAHEDSATAAQRELFEEIGVQPQNTLKLVGSVSTSEKLEDGYLNRETFTYCLIVGKISEITPVIDEYEVEAVDWFKLDMIEDIDNLTPGAKKSLNLLRGWLKKKD